MFKVVVVEDEDIIRRGLIKSIGWEKNNLELVGEANNGKEALTIISNTYPNIVILDINMPIMNGLEVLKRLPEKTYAVIILSGHSEFEYAQTAIQYGVVEYLLKPVDKEKLHEALEKAKNRVLYLNSISLDKEDKYKVLDTNKKVPSITLTKVLRYIEEHYDQKVVLEDLVEITNKSTSSINSRFQQHLGTTFNEFLTLYRIQKSIDLIKEHQYHMYEIAEMVGYSDYKYFNQVFNKVLGVPPKIVRTYYSRRV